MRGCVQSKNSPFLLLFVGEGSFRVRKTITEVGTTERDSRREWTVRGAGSGGRGLVLRGFEGRFEGVVGVLLHVHTIIFNFKINFYKISIFSSLLYSKTLFPLSF